MAVDLVKMVVDGWDSSWNYTGGFYQGYWQRMCDLYDNKRTEVGYHGISDTFVPMPYATVETMVAATAGDKPAVNYIQTRPDQSAEVEVLNGLFSYYWDLDNWTNKMLMHSRGLFKRGSSVLHLYWDIDHPCLRVIPLRDFFCDPTATILRYQQDARFMGYRFLADREELKKEQIIDPDKQELVPKYKNLDKLGDYEPGDQTDKQEKDTHMGSTLDKEAQKNQVEVICYFTKDNIYYVGNREAIIYESKNYFKERQEFLGWENPTGMFPFIIDVIEPDESLLYGKSIIDSISKPVELLNDLTNQSIDAVSWVLDPIMELDPQYASYIEKIKNVTGAVYPFKPGSLSAVQKPQVPTNAFAERSNIKNEIRETTGIDQVLRGMSSPSRTTAAEIKAQTQSTGRRFNLIVSQIENGGYYQLAKIVFQMVQMYVTTPTMYRIIGKNGVDWKTFDPKFFKGEYEPRVKLEATMEQNKNQKMRDLKELYSAMLGNPLVDQAGMTRLVIQKAFDLEPDEIDSLIVPPDQAQEKSDPKNDPKELINYKDAPPDIQAQMEEAAGYTASPTHGGAMETVASQQMADQATHGEQIAPMPSTSPTPFTTAPPTQAPEATPESVGASYGAQ